MGSKNKDKSKSKKSKKDKKHKKSKKVPATETDSILDEKLAKTKSEAPLREKKKEVDEVIAGQLERLKETMTKLKKREPVLPPESKVELPLDLPEAPVAKRRTLKAFAPPVETTFHQCKECNLQFVSEQLLSQHTKTHTKSLHYCPHCPVVTLDAPKLKRHMIIHTGEKPFKCDICGKMFGLEYNMKIHRRVHSGEKPHKCSLCGKQFAQRSNLKMHEVTHQQIFQIGQVVPSYELVVPEQEQKPSLSSYLKKKLETYKQNLVQSSSQLIKDNPNNYSDMNQQGEFKVLSRSEYLVEVLRGIRGEIKKDRCHQSHLANEVKKLQANIYRDCETEFLQMQSYQGLLAGIFQMEQLKMDAWKISMVCSDKAERMHLKSRRILGQEEPPVLVKTEEDIQSAVKIEI